MPKIDMDEVAEKPLDPAMENVRRKMVRTLGVSIGIMCIGLMAVAGAIVYKMTSRAPEAGTTPAASAVSVPSEGPVEARASLPAGFSVERVALDGSRILFYGKGVGGAAHAYVFDISSGRIVADVAVSPGR